MNTIKAGLLFLAFLFVSACGTQVVEFPLGGLDAAAIDARVGDGSTDATTDAAAVAPTVIAVTPLDMAAGVPLNTLVTATFSTAMDPLTITGMTFTVRQAATNVPGVVTYALATHIATFTPAAPLIGNLIYVATVTTGVRDTLGTAMAANYVWSFRTGGAALAPLVIAVTPLNGAINVGINVSPTATFNTPMDPLTISNLTFKLAQGNNPIVGVVTYDGLTNTATFNPNLALGVGLVYTATVTTGARSVGGVALATASVWSFTTGACSLAPITLGGAGRFGVLGGPTVTSTGQTIVTGDIGSSPGAAIIGFPPGIIVGARHAADPISAQGEADLTTAYNEAAGLSLCPITESGNLGGLTLAPGLYKSTSSLDISSGDLTLDAQGDVNAVWVFQIASTLTTTAGRQVILAGGAKASNVFWQVGTSATIGTTSAFKGTIMADQSVTLLTGATLVGRALARIAAVTLDANMVTVPAP